MSIASAAIYNDFQGLAALRSEASNTPSEAIGKVAAQFESLFVQMMLKSMRDATMDGGLFESDQMDTYQSMFDQQISLDLSSRGVLGLTDILVEELGGEKTTLAQSDGALSFAAAQALRAADNKVHQVTQVRPDSIGATAEAANEAPSFNPASPEEFIRGVWDYAVDAAEKLGLDPLVLVAQSALETGWGKRIIKAMEGSSSLNFFGIKADDSWQGASATVNSMEVRDGQAKLEKSSFRAYDSIASSFEDYVSFLKDNPRYQTALGKVADSGQFLRELQEAGYATDPGYAEKILGIVGQTSFGALIDQLKKF